MKRKPTMSIFYASKSGSLRFLLVLAAIVSKYCSLSSVLFLEKELTTMRRNELWILSTVVLWLEREVSTCDVDLIS